jgi:hypothetical protein
VFLLGDVDDTTLNALAASPHLSRLCNFGAQKSMPRILRELLPRMTGLHDLFLPTPWDHPPHVTNEVLSLLRLPNLPALQSLELRVKPGHALARALDRPGLRDLRLHVEDLPTAELAEVLAAPFVSGLRRLWLDEELSAAGCRLLATTPALTGLRSLRVCLHEGDSTEGLQAILDSPHLAQLTALHLVNLNEDDLALLARSQRAGNLHSLSLSSRFRGGTPAGMRRFLETAPLTNLHRLGLDMWLGGSETLGMLATRPVLPRLSHLSLLDCEIGVATRTELERSPHRSALRAVSMRDGFPVRVRGLVAPSAEPLWDTW